MREYTIALEVTQKNGGKSLFFRLYNDWVLSGLAIDGPQWLSGFLVEQELQAIGYYSWPEHAKENKKLILIPRIVMNTMIGQRWTLT